MKQEKHVLKSWTLFFSDIVTGERTSDIRATNDRRFMKGDLMELQEWNPINGKYTGNWALVEITYVQTNKSNPCAISREALRDDYTVLSIKLKETGNYSETKLFELNNGKYHEVTATDFVPTLRNRCGSDDGLRGPNSR